MSNFTKGKWEAGFPTIGGKPLRDADCQVSAEGSLIANVSHGAMFGSDEAMANQREANANLIASAPDMYEALEELVKRFRRDTTDKYMGAPQIVIDAEKALAKARGESNE